MGIISSIKLYSFIRPQHTGLFENMGTLNGITLYHSTLDESNPLVSGSASIAQSYNGDAAFLKREFQDQIDFIIPKEGCAIWTDYWSIYSPSKHKSLAYLFLNYINQPEIAAQNTNYLAYATTNSAAMPLLDKTLREDTIVFPDDAKLKRCQPYPAKQPATDRIMHAAYKRLINRRLKESRLKDETGIQ